MGAQSITRTLGVLSRWDRGEGRYCEEQASIFCLGLGLVTELSMLVSEV